MRRRIRSAAFPVHRHALPQLVVDGILVALAYFLAFWLRFEGDFRGSNQRYGHLLSDTIAWVVVLALVSLAAFGQYQRLWRFIGQRDY
ncbi:MAG: polysaccharide biosynthesis protein, partial [Solirubrobacteraceae bacterium]